MSFPMAQRDIINTRFSSESTATVLLPAGTVKPSGPRDSVCGFWNRCRVRDKEAC